MKGQSKLSSFVEAIFNVLIGFGVAIASQIIIFPLFGIHVELQTNLGIGAWFTVISLVRSYVIRRWFNTKLHRAAVAISRSTGETRMSKRMTAIRQDNASP